MGFNQGAYLQAHSSTRRSLSGSIAATDSSPLRRMHEPPLKYRRVFGSPRAQVGYSDQTFRQRSLIQGAAGDYGTVSCRCRRAHAPRQPRQLSDVDGDLPRLFAREQVVSCRLAIKMAGRGPVSVSASMAANL